MLKPVRCIDRDFSTKNTHYYEVTIIFRYGGFSFCVFDIKNNCFIRLEKKTFSNSKSVEFLSKQINENLEKNNWIEDCKSINFIFQSNKITLVPEAFYKKNDEALYLQFSNTIDKNQQILSDYLINVGAYLIYSIPSWLIKKLEKRFHQIKFFHNTSVLIESIHNLHKNRNTENIIFLNKKSQSIDLLYFNDNRLIYCNSFYCLTEEDVLYYLLFTIDCLKLNPLETTLKVMGDIDKNSSLLDMFQTYIKYTVLMKRTSQYSYSDTFRKLNEHRFFSLLNFQLCAL